MPKAFGEVYATHYTDIPKEIYPEIYYDACILLSATFPEY